MTNMHDRYLSCAESKENMSHAKFPFYTDITILQYKIKILQN